VKLLLNSGNVAAYLKDFLSRILLFLAAMNSQSCGSCHTYVDAALQVAFGKTPLAGTATTGHPDTVKLLFSH
jgi:hypothetical protein